MKKLVIAFMLSFILVGCDASGRGSSHSTKKVKEFLEGEVVPTISYFKDRDTQICFAYTWVGLGNGGPAMAEVPCEKAERSKRYVGEI